jgi:transmembrane sensor
MLKAPVQRALRDPIDEQAIFRIWRRISEERHRLRVSWRAIFVRAAIGAGLGLVLMAILQLVYPPHSPPGVTPVVMPLSLVDGSRLRTAEVSDQGTALTWPFSDGSELRFEPGTRWEPLVVSSSQLVSSLRRGRMLFDVKPDGMRRWIVEAGPVTIEVVGTRFSVERDERRVIVRVERGAVLVRGDPVPDKVQRLTDGQSIAVVLKPEPSAVSATPSAAGERRHATRSPEWLEHAQHGRFKDAYADLGSDGVRQEAVRTQALDRLLALADIARLSGHPSEAVAPLERIVRHHPDRPEAALAAVTLGRLLLDQLGRPREASATLERALALGAPIGLREDVYARLVEAHVRAGDRASAERAFDRYEHEFSNGRRLAEISRWLNPP